MRRNLVPLAALLLLGSIAYAQEAKQPDVFAKTVDIGKIYTHPLGYRILYLRSTLDWGEMYVPMTWFKWSGVGKGEVVWGNDPAYPYLVIYWVDGKFANIRLFLRSDPTDISYGVLDPTIDLSKQFDVQEPPKNF